MNYINISIVSRKIKLSSSNRPCLCIQGVFIHDNIDIFIYREVVMQWVVYTTFANIILYIFNNI